jgi:opacity protein-like surface antigen
MKRIGMAMALMVWIGVGIPGLAHAESEKNRFSFQLGGGVFSPFQGSSGIAVQGGIHITPLPRLMVGGEMDYRRYKTKILGVRGVETQTIGLQAVARLLVFPNGATPYAGAGFRTSVNIIDTGKIERDRPGIDVFNRVGLGSGIFGLAGFLVPVGQHFSFFAEGRASLDIQLTHVEKTDVENLGGFMGIGGVMIHL